MGDCQSPMGNADKATVLLLALDPHHRSPSLRCKYFKKRLVIRREGWAWECCSPWATLTMLLLLIVLPWPGTHTTGPPSLRWKIFRKSFGIRWEGWSWECCSLIQSKHGDPISYVYSTLSYFSFVLKTQTSVAGRSVLSALRRQLWIIESSFRSRKTFPWSYPGRFSCAPTSSRYHQTMHFKSGENTYADLFTDILCNAPLKEGHISFLRHDCPGEYEEPNGHRSHPTKSPGGTNGPRWEHPDVIIRSRLSVSKYRELY